jgi:hypothetical protein
MMEDNMRKIDLKGTWNFCLDQEKKGIDKQYFKETLDDTIELPATVATAKKVTPSNEKNTGYLTDPYALEGYTWYSKTVEFDEVEGKELFLVLERTRVSHVWINDSYVGNNNSLCTSHCYQITPYVQKQSKITIMIDNTSYPVKGGHMTSPDTQTNWNGITGGIYVEERSKIYLTKIKIYPDVQKKKIRVNVTLNGAESYTVTTSVTGDENAYQEENYQLQQGENSFVYTLGEDAKTWSEFTPTLYQLNLRLIKENNTVDEYHSSFGLREFKAGEKYFEINGVKTFLRGKHDGLIFPLTGHAPTDLESWLNVLGIAKEYGINHYRYHTCCPPEAAFEAADRLGIYMEPELPFWGTVTQEGDENHDEAGQQYLIEEGFRILDEFGNHPSFAMMSMGNELWGSKERLETILSGYKKHDNRHLYTQGSNNFQFVPCILDSEDFYCGVRFSRDRLFRGSYAMCDAPLGHIQTMAPNSNYNYDMMIRPTNFLGETVEDGEVTIQYGTGTKTVKVDASQEVIPQIPVVSHEIGQYATFPDFSEIDKYTGVLKARNFEVFKERVIEKGLLPMADKFFQASGRFAAHCYKDEIETALRSKELAGIQLLDLQDFSGQGTALVGILNALMENKGVISVCEWQQFCSETVLLAEFDKFTFTEGEQVEIKVKLAAYQLNTIINPELELTLSDGQKQLITKCVTVQGEFANGLFELNEFKLTMPETMHPQKLTLVVKLAQTKIVNSYDLWLYPLKIVNNIDQDIIITDDLANACESLANGNKVLYYPQNLNEANSIEGTYCTDFWCYPMFRSISESVGRAVPVGTHGLYVEKSHSIFDNFPTEIYSTPQWYDFVSNSRALILDDSEITPVVWTIDNFERNHMLGNILELQVGLGKLLISTSDLRKLSESVPAKQLEYSILSYMSSEKFKPTNIITVEGLKKIFQK